MIMITREDAKNRSISNETAWYQRSVEESFSLLSTTMAGIASDEAQRRLAQYGYNEVRLKRRSALIRFLLQFHNPLIYVGWEEKGRCWR